MFRWRKDVEDEELDEVAPVRERRLKPAPWIAVFLSVLMPGFGHGYCRMWGRGIVFFLFATGFTVLGVVSNWAGFAGMTFLSTVGTVFYALCIVDTYRCAVNSKRGISPRLSGKWLIGLFALALAIFLLAFSVVVTGTIAINFIGYAVNVDSKSMDPTLKPGEKVLANRQMRFTDDLRNGDLVAVNIPGYKRKEEVRRVIALPGQRVMMMCGQVMLDGTEIREDYVSYRQELSTHIPGHRAIYFQELVVPEDSVFLLSDVRDLGEDSREWGPVKETRILGRVDFLFYPPERHQQFADSYLSALTRKLIRLISLGRRRL